MKTALCLLTLNEIECLNLLFDKIPKPGPDAGFDGIYAIDGGSTDGTIEFFKERNIPIIGQSKKGRGQAFQNAFNEIDAEAFIFFSPDGNEEIEDIKKFKPLLKEGADIVIASRMCQGAVNEEDQDLLKWRKWANNAFNIFANLFFRKKGPFITDSINGFRAITKNASETLKLDAPDYTIEYQMTIRGFKHQLNIVEFPTHEGQRLAGDTGAPSIPTGIRFIKRFFRELLG
ncbi:glycosyltransferase family 2 protein [Bacteriovoracaceae bacterium]|nr:glycosyltransferase family 2 protein [Bacteriovoracaceae bacterium]